jgi:hypothetical protein
VRRLDDSPVQTANRHVVRLAGVVIGYSDLEDAWVDDGRARGVFRPGVGYELVQPVFRLYRDAVPAPDGPVRDEEKLARYHASRDALGLTLEDADGVVVRTTAVHIADYADEGADGPRHLEVLIADDGYWARRAARDGA